MRILIVKTSSMGDVIHTLPALTDAGNAIPNITFDWLVEENFAEVPTWHPLVKKVIPIAWRRWRKKIFSRTTWHEIFNLYKNLRAEKYDLIIDAQGLVKSAFFSSFARGVKSGLDWTSARESFASVFYKRKSTVVFEQHAVVRARSLFSQALNYPLPRKLPDYGVDRKQFLREQPAIAYVVFIHATTLDSKHWPETSWMELGKIANAKGYAVKLPWGNPAELERAKRIAAACEQAEILPRLDLLGIAGVLAGATAAVAVDTGLGHLAAALDVPGVSIYGPTNPEFTGALGKSQIHLSAKFACAPCLSKICHYQNESTQKPACFTSLPANMVWDSVERLL